MNLPYNSQQIVDLSNIELNKSISYLDLEKLGDQFYQENLENLELFIQRVTTYWIFVKYWASQNFQIDQTYNRFLSLQYLYSALHIEFYCATDVFLTL